MRTRFLCLLLLICSTLSGQAPSSLSLHNIFREYQFHPNSVDRFRSMADGEHYTVIESDLSIVKYDYKTGLNKTTSFAGECIARYHSVYQ